MARNVTPWSLKRSLTVASSASSSPATSTPPCVVEQLVDAAETDEPDHRPGDARAPGRRPRGDGARRRARRRPASTPAGANSRSVVRGAAGARASSTPPPLAAPSCDGARAAAVAGLSKIWPGVGGGLHLAGERSPPARPRPVHGASRRRGRSRTSPLWTPTDMRRLTRPAEVWRFPTTRKPARMAAVAAAARRSWPSPQKNTSTASPPYFSMLPAVGGGLLEQLGEHRVEDVGQLLGANPALPREPLGHGRESGDVAERQAPGDAPVARVRCLLRPRQHQPRHVWREIWSHVPRAPGYPRDRASVECACACGSSWCGSAVDAAATVAGSSPSAIALSATPASPVARGRGPSAARWPGSTASRPALPTTASCRTVASTSANAIASRAPASGPIGRPMKRVTAQRTHTPALAAAIASHVARLLPRNEKRCRRQLRAVPRPRRRRQRARTRRSASGAKAR